MIPGVVGGLRLSDRAPGLVLADDVEIGVDVEIGARVARLLREDEMVELPDARRG